MLRPEPEPKKLELMARDEAGIAGSPECDTDGLSPGPANLVEDVRDAHVAMGVARGLVEVVAATGVDRQAFLYNTGLTAEQLSAPEGRLAYPEFARILDLAIEATGDEMLGLRWAGILTERTLVPISHLVSHTRSLAQSLRLLARYCHLLSNRRGYEVTVSGKTATLRFIPAAGENERHRRFASELIVGGFFRFIRSFDRSAPCGIASFAHTPPDQPQRDAYDRFFCGGVRFGHAFTGLEFDRRILAAPSPQCDDEVCDALRDVVEQRLARIDRGTPWTSRVHDWLVRRGLNERTDMSEAARSAGVSIRTLRRRLLAEGYAYDDVLREVRCRSAKRMLQMPEASIQAVAYKLGFSNPSAFHRAFKRWTGLTPNAYRQAQLGAQKPVRED